MQIKRTFEEILKLKRCFKNTKQIFRSPEDFKRKLCAQRMKFIIKTLHIDS